jgi:hypothetical protein
MKKLLCLFGMLIVFILLSNGAAWGQKSGMGFGIILGEPTGIDGKFWLSGRTAFDAAAAWSFANHSHFQVQGDFVFHNYSVLKKAFEVQRGDLPLYYGIGARLRLDPNSNEFGIRFVAGMSYIFPNAPFDIFLEVAPIMDLAPDTELDGSAAVGFRIWLK